MSSAQRALATQPKAASVRNMTRGCFVGLRLAALLAANVTTALLPMTVLAQGAPAVSDPVKDVARQRYEEGVKALDEKRFEDARLAFEQAFKLIGSPAVLLNLGVAESKTNRCVDAGNHLHRFLREHKSATPDNRALATSTLEECKKKVSTLSISVDAPASEIAIDGKVVGRSPLEDPYFVEPGPHVVTASNNGKSATNKVDVLKGGSSSVLLTLGGTAPPPPVNPAVGGTPTQPVGQPGYPGMQPQPFIPPPQTDSAGEDFGSWYVRSPLAWVGTGVVGVGLGVSIAFTALSADSLSVTNSIADQIRAQAAADGVQGAPCGTEAGANDVYPIACKDARDAQDVHDANQAVTIVGWVTTSLALAGTVTYVMLDWYAGSRTEGPPRSGERAPSVAFVPSVSPVGVGGLFVGEF